MAMIQNPEIAQSHRRAQAAEEIVRKIISDPYNAFEKEWLRYFPETLADVISYKQDPGCSCRHKLIDAFMRNRLAGDELIARFLPSLVEPAKEVGTPVEMIGLKDLEGSVYEISLDKKDWSQLVAELKRTKATFRGIVPVVVGDKLRLMFY